MASQRKTGRPTKKSSGGTVYQLKITLKNISPPIWRRLQINDCSLAKLHQLIQDSMGWHACHLHTFEIGGAQYAEPSEFDDEDLLDSRKLKLSQVIAQGFKKFGYVYDMGDNWDHVIQVEKTLPAEPGVKYPRCIDGKRACPPEDCGGAWGYGDFLEALKNPRHAQHGEMLEWVGGEFDPEKFDLEETNNLLH